MRQREEVEAVLQIERSTDVKLRVAKKVTLNWLRGRNYRLSTLDLACLTWRRLRDGRLEVQSIKPIAEVVRGVAAQSNIELAG